MGNPSSTILCCVGAALLCHFLFVLVASCFVSLIARSFAVLWFRICLLGWIYLMTIGIFGALSVIPIKFPSK